jgi:hypothetical protein
MPLIEKENDMSKLTRFALIAAVLLLLPLAAQAAPLHWTAVASTGTVDPNSNGIYGYSGAGGSPALGYNSSGSLVSITSRYNVTNTTGTETPAWTTFEMGYTDPTAGGAVVARLYQVDPCTGNTTQICQINSVTATQSCRSCTFSASTFNFSTETYMVVVSIIRTSSTQFPLLYTLRID